MKKYILILVVSLLGISLVIYYFDNEYGQGSIETTDKTPNDWFFRQRAYPFETINHHAYLAATKTAKQQRLTRSDREEVAWEFAGPTNIEGRITDIEIQGGSQNIFIGAASGGVFKKSMMGAIWEPVFDDETSLSIGDIAISSSTPEVIYIGTGEANAGGGSLAYDGTGIFKSTDSGLTWENKGLENSGSIGRMVVHPTDPDIVYVAAMGRLFADGSQGGVFKTTDGGLSWEQKLFISDSTGSIDIVIDPSNPEIIYTAMWERVRRPGRRSYGGPTSGIFKSTDGGDNWNELTNGLPSSAGDKGRIGIDISESNPNILYAVYADRIGYFQGIYKTINGGESWAHADNGVSSNVFSSFGWWFGRIKVDPVNPDISYLIALNLHKTEDGGNSWNNISGGQTHVDQHVVCINHANNNQIFLGNDGGFYSSINGGNSWNWNSNLPITQFYTCEVDEQYPERVYGGTQDNGTNRTMSGALDDWNMIYGGDGFRVLVNTENNNYVYAEYQYGGLGRSINGGGSFSGATNGVSGSDRFNWNCPLVFDPQNPQTLFFGSNKLYKSTNYAQSWNAISNDLTNGDEGGNIAYNTLTAIGVSPINQEYIYTGSDDGNVWFTDDGGENWNNISVDLPNRWVTSVVADPNDENIVFVTFSGYRWDEYLPHVFRSDNNGQNWIDISSDLPEAPVNEIIVDPDLDGYLYIATDFGVYYSENGGNNWMPAGTEIPLIVVNDIRLHNPSRKLIEATFGRGIYTLDLSVLTGFNKSVTDLSAELNCYPNPFYYQLEIEIPKGLEDKQIKVEVLNSNGQLINIIFEGVINKPLQNLTWDGFGKSGNHLSAGLYFIRLTVDDRVFIAKVVLSDS